MPMKMSHQEPSTFFGCGLRQRESDLQLLEGGYGSNAKTVMIVAAILGVSLVLLCIPLERWFPLQDFLREHIFALNLHNSIRERAAYGLWTLLTIVTCVLVLLGPRSLADWIARPIALHQVEYVRWPLAQLLVILVIAAVAFAVWSDPTYSRVAVYAALAVLIVLPMTSRRIGTVIAAVGGRYVWLVLAGYAGVLLLPGLFGHGAYETLVFVNTIDYHYSIVFGSAELLRDSAIDRSIVRLNYGLLSALSAVKLGALFGVETFGDYIRLTQSYQIAFALVLFVSAWLWARGNRYFLLLVAAAILPWVSTVHLSVVAPNQSGYRMMVFAALPALIATIPRIGNTIVRVAAAVVFASVLMLWNVETGLAAFAAIVTATLLSEYRAGRRIAGLAVVAVAVTACTTFAVLSAYSIYLHGGMISSITIRHLNDILVGGYGGLQNKGDLIAVGIAGFTTVVLLQSCVAARRGLLSDLALARTAICMAILVWFAYYANRPGPWNLWGIYVLAVFLVEPITRPEFWSTRAEQLRRPLASPVIVLAVLALVMIPVHAHSFLYHNRAISLRSTPNFQGLELPTIMVDHFRSQAQVLSAAPHRTVYLSAVPFISGLTSNRHNSLSVFDSFGETWTPGGLARLRQQIVDLDPELVLVEAKASPLFGVAVYGPRFVWPREDFFNRLRKILGDHFTRDGEAGGWEAWRRNAPASR